MSNANAEFTRPGYVVQVEFLVRADQLARVGDEVDMDLRGAGRCCDEVGELPLPLEIVVGNVQTHQRVNYRMTNALFRQLRDDPQKLSVLCYADHAPHAEAGLILVDERL